MNDATRCHSCGHKANVHERGTVCLASRCQCTLLIPTFTFKEVEKALWSVLDPPPGTHARTMAEGWTLKLLATLESPE